MSSFHLVIRCSGERTETVSRQLAKIQIPADEKISIVSEVPFEAALRTAYEAGVEAGKEWTVTLDADVLLRKNAISELLEHAEQMPSHFIELEGRVFDKITGRYRQAGHRIYRTELLPLALKQIPDPGSRIQPEYFTVLRMGELGHPFRHIGCVTGLHDFEQSYGDLYRKALVHSRKMSSLVGDLIQRCAERLHEDPDFLVILKGLWDGLTMKDPPRVDRRLFQERARETLKALGMEEKGRIDDADGFVGAFPAMFEAVTSQTPPSDVATMDEPSQAGSGERSWIDKVQGRMSKRGVIRGSVACLGALLSRAGRALDR